MGLNNLFAIVTTSGDAVLVKGGAVKAEHYREKNEIRAMQGTRVTLRKHGLEIWGGSTTDIIGSTSSGTKGSNISTGQRSGSQLGSYTPKALKGYAWGIYT